MVRARLEEEWKRRAKRGALTMHLMAAITNGADAFILFGIMVIGMFITLLLTISR